MKYKGFDKILLMALNKDPNMRVAFWKAEYRKSEYSHKVFLEMLIQSFHGYEFQLDLMEEELKINNKGSVPDLGIPLAYETDQEMTGYLKKYDLGALAKALIDLGEEWGFDEETEKKILSVKKNTLNEVKKAFKSASNKEVLISKLDNLIDDLEIDKRQISRKNKRNNTEKFGDFIYEIEDSISTVKKFKIEILDAKTDGTKKNLKISPIHWLKGEESLRQFLQSIKKAGLIESRDTDEIIQEHFLVDGKAPTKKLQLIKWLSESKYLAYLMHRLAEEFIINIKGRKHELTASHFISSDDKSLNTNSLASQLSTLMKHSKSTEDNIKSIERIIQQVKS